MSKPRTPRRQGSFGDMPGVSSVIADARAEVERPSLKNPSRPFTPADNQRRLFYSNEYTSRPQSAYTVESLTSGFMDDTPSQGQLPRALDPISLSQPRPPSERSERKRPTSRGRGDGSSRRSERGDRSSRGDTSARGRAPAQQYEAVHFEDEVQAPNLDVFGDAELAARMENLGGASSAGAGSARGRPANTAPSRRDEPTAAAAAPPPPEKTSQPEPELSEEEYAFIGMWHTLAHEHLPKLDTSTPLFTLVAEVQKVWHLIDAHDWSEHRAERNKLLRALFRLVDNNDPELLMKICRIALRLASPGGATLLNTCKLLFKLSKSEQNDSYFRSEEIITPLLQTVSHPDNQTFEMLLYAIGALKNISSQDTNQKYLAQQGGIVVLDGILQWKGQVPSEEKRAQLLVQVSASLRNLAISNANRKQFLQLNVIQHLMEHLSSFASQGELMLNIVRILSKLSLFEDCRKVISASPENTRALFNLLAVHGRNAPLVIRVCFILGNVTSKIDKHRRVIADTPGGIDTLLGLLYDYTLIDETNGEQLTELSDGSNPGKLRQVQFSIRETEDVLTKLIRLIAHLGINEEIGPVIAADEGLEPLVTLLERKKIDNSEELVLNIVSAMTNFSFYYTESNVILQHQKKLTKLMTPLLLHENEEAVVEAARSFGNFSRNQAVRKLMAHKRINEMMVILLDHGNREVLYSVTGVLMNLAGDHQHKDTLVGALMIDKLLDVIGYYGVSDPELASIILKTVFNLCLEAAHMYLTETQLDAFGDTVQRLADAVDQAGQATPAQLELREVAKAMPAVFRLHRTLPMSAVGTRHDLEPLTDPEDDSDA